MIILCRRHTSSQPAPSIANRSLDASSAIKWNAIAREEPCGRRGVNYLPGFPPSNSIRLSSCRITCMASCFCCGPTHRAGQAPPLRRPTPPAVRRGDPWVARRLPAWAGDSASRVPSLGQIVGAFKSLSTSAVNHLLDRSGSVWQRNYYEHIVRSGKDLDAIRVYVDQNPQQWRNDRENPRAQSISPYPFSS